MSVMRGQVPSALPVEGKSSEPQSGTKRSDSPIIPKDEAAKPEETATASAPLSEPNADPMITGEMLKEEEELHKKTLEEEAEMKKNSAEQMKNISEDIKEQRQNRLQFLLSKSNMYAAYLVKRMQEQKEELAKKEEKRKKKAARSVEKVNEKKTNNEEQSKCVIPDSLKVTTQSASRRSPRVPKMTEKLVASKQVNKKKGTKRKAETVDNYKISDYLEDALEKSKRQKVDETNGSKEASVSDDATKSNEEMRLLRHKADVEGRVIKGEAVDPAQPFMFNGGVLRPYQVEGFQWLRSLYENGVNGILADEMGLGKTIQCIALVSHLVYNGVPGPFLVCAPLSTVPNWVSEFSRFAPGVPIVLYHGPKEERVKMRRKIHKKHTIRKNVETMPVVITSYEIAMADRVAVQAHEWKLIIVDEGHRIKNFRCKLVTELKLYRSTHRLLLTGTPLQNNLAELWSLLNFLLPEIFDDLGSFQMWFDIDYLEHAEEAHEEIVADEQKNSILSTLHKILSPFMLRRMKTDVELVIPPKREVMVYAPLTPKQQHLYKSTVDKSIRYMVEERPDVQPECDEKGRPKRKSTLAVDYSIMCQNASEEEPVKNKKKDEEKIDAWVKAIEDHQEKVAESRQKKEGPKTSVVRVQMRNTLMMLKKACNHPYLIEYPLTEDGEYKVDEELITSSGKLMLLDRMLSELKKRGHKVLIFSQMTQILDIIQDYCYYRKHNFCRLDGSYSLDERRQQIDDFNDPNGGALVFLLSTRAGGLGINLTAADTVVIFDSDWNPQSDLQAQDRCHRIGQTRPVMVYRLITANTVDVKIVERAAAKRKLEKLVIYKRRFRKGCLDEQSFTQDLEPINPHELLRMLEESDYDGVVENDVISDHDLDCLLDRSDMYRIWNATGAASDEAKEIAAKASVQHDIEGVFKVIDNGVDSAPVESTTTESESHCENESGLETSVDNPVDAAS